MSFRNNNNNRSKPLEFVHGLDEEDDESSRFRAAIYKQVENFKAAAVGQPVDMEAQHTKVLGLLDQALSQVSQTVHGRLLQCESQAKALLNKLDAAGDASTSQNAFLEDSVGDLNDDYLASLIGNVESMLKKEENHVDLEDLKEEADALAQECLDIQTSLLENRSFYLSLAVHMESELPTLPRDCATLMVGQHLGGLVDCNSIVSSIVLALSDVYKTLTELKNASSSRHGKKWEAPASFERVTSKYWIHEYRLPQVLTTIVHEAPLLVYGQEGLLTTTEERDHQTSLADTNKLWDVLATPISSVYFDSPKMAMYKERLARREGAQLFRVRWYGNARPKGKQCVFLELKTHHEKWINHKSVKERVVVQEQDMPVFLDKSTRWKGDVSYALAKDIVLRGNPKYCDSTKEAELNRQIALICQMHNLVVDMALQPCVRSSYQRAAFQSPESNKLRLTVDRNVTVIDETKNTTTSDWCLNDDDAKDPSRIKVVPYAIFEVKLAGDTDMPSTIQSLIDDELAIADAYKFSKFLTGAASFQQDVIKTLPYWADHEKFRAMFFDESKEEEQVEFAVDESERPSLESFEETASATVSLLDESTKTDNEYEGVLKKEQEPTKSILRCPSTSTLTGVHSAASSVSSTSGFLRRSKRISRDPEPSRRRFSSDTLSVFSGLDSSKSFRNKKLAPKKAVRVEPKSYFANERTFIQWISAALLLVTVAAILAEHNETSPQVYPVGLFLLSCAVFVVVYSMYVYYRRLQLMRSGAAYGYVDRMGPLLLASAVLIGVVILLTNMVQVAKGTSTTAGADAQSYIVAGEKCHQHALSNINLFHYQPSDILIDSKRKMMLVPSLNEISGLSLEDDTDGNVRQLLKTPNGKVDLEALVYAGDRLFAVWEGEAKSQLVELQWTPEDTLEVIHTYWIHSSLSEGATFIDNELYIVDNNIDLEDPHLSGGIQVYDLPVFGTNTTIDIHLNPTRRLARKVLSKGLEGDSKIGSLAYFEDKMYVLHDNMQLVRVWDPRKGILLEEITLPAAEQGAEKQWEGFALERRMHETSANEQGNLRGQQDEQSGTLYLHLALDSPPQIWSLQVNEDDEGRIVLPSCAHGR